jgi:hypothetical protein
MKVTVTATRDFPLATGPEGAQSRRLVLDGEELTDINLTLARKLHERGLTTAPPEPDEKPTKSHKKTAAAD